MAAALPSEAAAPLQFDYHRSLTPMLGVLLGLAIAETMVLHIVAMVVWGWKVAVGLALVDLSFVAMLVRMLRSFRRLPVILDGRRLTMRAGVHSSITIDLDNIAAFRANWNAEAIKRRTTLNLALIAWPNVVFDLREPIKVRRRRIISTIAHRLDDSASFQAAIARLERPHADR